MTNIPGFDGLHAVTQDKLLREVVRSNLKTGLGSWLFLNLSGMQRLNAMCASKPQHGHGGRDK